MGTIGVIVLSYNRPRWLGEALDSARGADQIVIADDGSDFDPLQVASKLQMEVEIVRNEPIPIAQRMHTPRMGALFNRALDTMHTSYVGYVCDDDVLAQGWLEAARGWLDDYPQDHMVRGDWHTLTTSRSAFGPGPWALTTGNFVHRLECYSVEGCRWNEQALAVQDALFLTDYLHVHQLPHGGYTVPHVGRLAGWRREHQYNLIHFSESLGFADRAASVLGGFMEEGHA